MPILGRCPRGRQHRARPDCGAEHAPLLPYLPPSPPCCHPRRRLAGLAGGEQRRRARPPPNAAQVLRMSCLCTVPRYCVLLRQGVPGDKLFMLLHGEMRVRNDKGLEKVPLHSIA